MLPDPALTALAAALPEFTPRQHAVLEVALGLLVAGGEAGLTTAGLARAANCSKESLYKWFGDRDGLLAAVIGFQAAKVRVTVPERPDAEGFRAEVGRFARDLLDVLAGQESLALNRLAIGQASRAGSRLGLMVLERGRRTIEARARRLLEAGRRAGHLDADDIGEAYGTLYGLIVRDAHARLLLGDPDPFTRDDRARQADRAVDQFFRLHGTGTKHAAGAGAGGLSTTTA